MNRGANRNRIFPKDDDYELFINVLKEACSLFNVYICLLISQAERSKQKIYKEFMDNCLDDEVMKFYSKKAQR